MEVITSRIFGAGKFATAISRARTRASSKYISSPSATTKVDLLESNTDKGDVEGASAPGSPSIERSAGTSWTLPSRP